MRSTICSFGECLKPPVNAPSSVPTAVFLLKPRVSTTSVSRSHLATESLGIGCRASSQFFARGERCRHRTLDGFKLVNGTAFGVDIPTGAQRFAAEYDYGRHSGTAYPKLQISRMAAPILSRSKMAFMLRFLSGRVLWASISMSEMFRSN